MRVFKCQQNTPEWLHIRCGRITASRMGDVMAKRKRGDAELACRKNYRMELLCERLTGRAYDHYVSPEMDRGHEQEKFARAAYEVATGEMVEEVGFVMHPTMDFTGSSPDSLVGVSGGLEMKNPNTSTHLEWMEAGVVPPEHEPQVMWNMACSGAQWWDFMSFDDRLPVGLRVFIARLSRDEARIAEMEEEVQKLHAEVEYKAMMLGAAPWQPIMPSTQEMVSIGDLSIPKDLSDMLDSEVADLGMTP